MREIKFRGACVRTNKFVYGAYFELEGPLQCMGVKKEKSQHFIVQTGFADWNMPREAEFHAISPETLGQFTGLHDKNGVEIYEGDIVKLHVENYADFWIKEKFVVEEKTWHGDCCYLQSISNYIAEEHDEDDYMEIIGNIYENPELLEVPHDTKI